MIYWATPLGEKTDEIFQEPSRLNLEKKNFQILLVRRENITIFFDEMLCSFPSVTNQVNQVKSSLFIFYYWLTPQAVGSLFSSDLSANLSWLNTISEIPMEPIIINT